MERFERVECLGDTTLACSIKTVYKAFQQVPHQLINNSYQVVTRAVFRQQIVRCEDDVGLRIHAVV